MSFADRYLADDEELVHATRQHWTEIITEFLLLALILIVAGVLWWLIPTGNDWGRIADYVVAGVGVLAALWFWLIPLLRWRSIVYIVTTKRIYKRSGFLTKTEHSIPLVRVNDVSLRATLWERIMREGTLSSQSASEHGMLTLKHVPDPEGMKDCIYQALDVEQPQES